MNKILLGLSILIFASFGNGSSKSNKTENSSESQFQWDFSKQRKFIYSFSQTVNGENKMDKDRPAKKTYMTGFGHLNVRVKENNLADLSLTDIEMKMIMFNEDGTPRDTMTQKAPTNVVQDMKPDGSFGDSNTDILFDMLFPLPNKNLKKGDSDEILMQIPFNANGSRLYSKGQNTLTFTGYEEIEGRNCAVLKGIIDISKLDIPEELEGEYECSTTGNATYYFELENGFYVGADIQMVMDVMMDSETENEDDFGMFMKMKSVNVYKIRLEEIEEDKIEVEHVSTDKNDEFSIIQNITWLDKNGTEICYQIEYEITNSKFLEIEQIKFDIQSIVRSITETNNVLKLISFESRIYGDSLIISEILKQINLNDNNIKSLVIKNVGLSQLYLNGLLEYYKDKKEEFNYYQTLNIDITMVNGYVGDPKITEKRETYSSFFEIKTKYNSRLKIELLICRRKTNLNAAWENNDITESIKNILTDSLEQFSMSEMYYGGKHMALEEMIKNIIATYDNETRWVEFHPQIPEDVERKWNELSNERIESLKKIILLDKKLKSNENLSKEMKKEIEKDIIKLEENIKLIKQREAEARKV